MSHLIPQRNSLPRKGKHWSQHVRDTLLLRAPSSGNFNLHIEGGAENGEFICVGEIRQDRIKYKRGKLHPGNIILEINGTPVAGYTQFDVLSLINGSNGSLELRTIKQGDQITRDLQKFLSTRFDKNTVDSDLQQTIRENLYNRTIPCTTRTPRNGEIPGVDYVFLTLEEFINLERSGNLLESGIYEGNHYGTPKPPREPHPLNNMLDDTESHRQYQSQNVKSPDSLGFLPPNWEIAYTEDNVKYFIDHSTGSTQWIDPRLALVKKATPEDCSDDELPYGWERVDDAKYGTYYIDHVNRKTQFENPVQAHRRQHESNSMSYSSAPPPHQGPPSLQSAAALAKRQEAEAHSRWPEVELFQTELPAYTVNSMGDQPRLHPFSANGQQIQGEVIRTELLKGSRGFGFTIVGGDQIGEMLQIKSIVPDGAAAKDGRLRMGDALVKVNGMSVLSKSHQDVVSMFQAMPLGEPVELELIRGYPLPFDPDDPSVETIGSYTVVRGPPARSESPLPPSSSDNSPVVSSRLSRHNHLANEWNNTSEEPMASPIAPPPVYMSSTFPRTSTTNSLPRSAPELLTVPVVKGPMGFGFTIADSPYGQRVRQILDAPRCQGLKEGDILVEINKQLIRSCTHNEAVNILKECPKGQEALIVVQRGGMPTPLKNSPAFGRRDNVMEPEVAVPRVARPKSTPVMSSDHARRDQHGGSTGNLASTGESTRNQETGYENRKLGQPALDKNSEALLNSYPSLKRAVANAARRSMENLDSPDLPPPPVTQESQTFDVHLKRGEMGFGFRIIGGQEENTQVAIGTIVRGGPADSSHQLLRGDEIHYVDGINVVGSTHRRVISLMGNAALAGEVTLGIFRNPVRAGRAPSTGTLRRSVSASSELSEATAVGSSSRQASQSTGNLSHYGRKPVPYQEETASVRSFHSTTGNMGSSPERSTQRNRRHSESDAKAEPQGPVYYRDVTLERLENESFGFVIFSSVQKSGSTIGRIIQGSPADRCRQLHVGDRLVAVNGVDIVGVYHGDIVDTIKQSGRYVTLTIAQQRPIDNFETRRLSRMSAPDLSNANGTESELNRRRDADQWNRDNAYSDQGSLERTRKDHQYYDTQNQPLQVPPKVPPRVAPKPSRETLRMVHEERRRQQNDYSDNPRQSNPEIRTRPPPPSRDNRENIKDQRRVSKQVFEVDLTRDLQGYGFSIRGGTELGLPIFVLRMAEGGAAHRDGRLKIGDEIVQINRTSTAQLAHSEAINLIKSGGNRVRLLIQRSNKPVYLDAIPNGGHAISGGGSLPRPTMKNPAYNAIYQS